MCRLPHLAWVALLLGMRFMPSTIRYNIYFSLLCSMSALSWILIRPTMAVSFPLQLDILPAATTHASRCLFMSALRHSRCLQPVTLCSSCERMHKIHKEATEILNGRYSTPARYKE